MKKQARRTGETAPTTPPSVPLMAEMPGVPIVSSKSASRGFEMQSMLDASRSFPRDECSPLLKFVLAENAQPQNSFKGRHAPPFDLTKISTDTGTPAQLKRARPRSFFIFITSFVLSQPVHEKKGFAAVTIPPESFFAPPNTRIEENPETLSSPFHPSLMSWHERSTDKVAPSSRLTSQSSRKIEITSLHFTSLVQFCPTTSMPMLSTLCQSKHMHLLFRLSH